jgi:hypothetical protein
MLVQRAPRRWRSATSLQNASERPLQDPTRAPGNARQDRRVGQIAYGPSDHGSRTCHHRRPLHARRHDGLRLRPVAPTARRRSRWTFCPRCSYRSSLRTSRIEGYVVQELAPTHRRAARLSLPRLVLRGPGDEERARVREEHGTHRRLTASPGATSGEPKP